MVTLSEELTWRGFVNQTTFNDISQLDGDSLSFYFGVDPSADSMTIGNLAAAMMVRHFIDHGHKATLLVGGATGMIGDPDGKSEERQLKTLDDIARNKAAIAAQYRTLFADNEFELVDNYEWFKGINYLDFLRDIGKHAPMSQMLGREFVQSRLGRDGAGISYAEFSYALIQGYDFLHLYRHKGIVLQVCGADQWGNSIAGVELIRRIEGGEAHVWSVPLVVNKTTGVKFGKSEGGAVWLDAKKTSPYKFYQFWLNIDDAGVIDYLKIYTLLSQDEINALAQQQSENPGARFAQKALAREVTKLVHGEERTQDVIRITDVLFGVLDIAALSESELNDLSAEIPYLQHGFTIVESLVESGIASSNGEARRLIAGGAITLNGEKVAEDSIVFPRSLLKKGKNTYVLIR